MRDRQLLPLHENLLSHEKWGHRLISRGCLVIQHKCPYCHDWVSPTIKGPKSKSLLHEKNEHGLRAIPVRVSGYVAP